MKLPEDYSVAARVWALRQFGGVGPRTFRTLMAYFGSLENIFSLEMDELLAINGLGQKRSEKIFDSRQTLDEAEEFIDMLEEREIKHTTLFDNNYPQRFRELNDPPPIIFARGEIPAADEKVVAIVGSHKASDEGISYAVDLAGRLAKRDVAIASGLARGIDASAHIGALRAGGRSYALLGSGFDHISPEENRPLAEEMVLKGGLISEYAPDSRSSPGRHMARNRLIVGLSQAVVIGEIFGDSTGTLDSASCCRELGKLMFILTEGIDAPGKDNSGVEKVLKMGAIPVELIKAEEMILNSLV
jgi:DNA processing protein